MYSYGLSGGQPTKQNLLWQDRRVVAQQQQSDGWWNRIKKSVSSTEAPQLTPTKVFSSDKVMLGGRNVLNLPERQENPQLFKIDNIEDGPTRPQLNLGNIESQFCLPTSQQNTQLQSPNHIIETSAIRTPTPPTESKESPQDQMPSVKSERQSKVARLAEMVTESETEIINPPSPFMDMSRRKPPPVPNGAPHPRSSLMEVSYAGGDKINFVKDAVSLFEKNSPPLQRKTSPQDVGIPIKIPSKAVNTRQKSRGPSRAPSNPNLFQQVIPTTAETPGISERLSVSCDFQAPGGTETSISRDTSLSDAKSLDSRLDTLSPGVKEKKASVFRGLIKATRSRINPDSNQLGKDKSNTDPSRRKLRRSSSVKPVKSEILLENKSIDPVQTSWHLSKSGRRRKPSHLELKEEFSVKGFDNFMMY